MLYKSDVRYNTYISLGIINKFLGRFFNRYVCKWFNSSILHVVFLRPAINGCGKFEHNIMHDFFLIQILTISYTILFGYKKFTLDFLTLNSLKNYC